MDQTMDAKIKGRVRLWLRSEKAMGLSSVAAPRKIAVAAGPAVREELPVEPEVEKVREIPRMHLADRSTPELSTQGPELEKSAAASIAIFGADAAEPFSAPVLSREEKVRALAAMDDKEVRTCTKCRLCETRTHTVFGEGDPEAQIFFIGEGPGENEDLSGRPFVGRAGQKLDDMIRSMGLAREQVFIANIVKCRPPANREPAPDETSTCTPYLVRQLEIVRPKVIVTLGKPSTQYMLQSKLSMSRLRGTWQQWRGIKLMPTYHPAYLLRNYTPETRMAVWSDLKQVMAFLGLASSK